MIERKATRNATADLFKRYLDICLAQDASGEDPESRLSIANLIWICARGAEMRDELPLDKLSRWLGFVQGCLLMRGIIDTDEERDHSRPLFHAAYRSDGIHIPAKEERG